MNRYILYATGEFAEGDVDAMREALKKSKGPGNFRNLFVHAPSGKDGGIKLLPFDECRGIPDSRRFAFPWRRLHITVAVGG